MKNSMMRHRRCVILKPTTPMATPGEVRKAWNDDVPFHLVTSDGIGKLIKRSEAIAEDIREVSISFIGNQQLVLRVS